MGSGCLSSVEAMKTEHFTEEIGTYYETVLLLAKMEQNHTHF